MKVVVSVHGRYHAFELANGLYRRGHLAQLLTTYPSFVARCFLDDGLPLRTAPVLEFWRRAHGRFPIGPRPDIGIARAFGRFAARTISAGADLFVGWSSATLEVVPVAHANGTKIIVERGSTHITYQTEILSEAYRRFGLDFGATDPAIIDRELAEYESADRIAVPSRFAAQTFIDRGMPLEKIIVNPLGVDVTSFVAARSRPKGRRLRILFVGAVGIRKGIPTLLQAFASVCGKAELHLIGPLESELKAVLADMPTDGVVFRGALPSRALPDEYRRADIFCLPSVEEGFGMVVLQAMASGLPVVTTEVAGVADVITSGKDGFIIQSGDEAALAEVVDELLTDPQLRHEIGETGRSRVAQGFSWDDYVDRSVDVYRSIFA